VGLILPMPPDLAQLFVPLTEVSFLLPEEAALHGPMHELAENAIRGSRACRAKAQEMQVLVFEAFREGGLLYVDVAVADVLERNGLEPSRLILEITETVLIDHPVATQNLLTLRALGVRISIDDFGTGFTSIGQLPKLNADSASPVSFI